MEFGPHVVAVQTLVFDRTGKREVAAVQNVKITSAVVDDSFQQGTVLAEYAVGDEQLRYEFSVQARGDSWVISNGLAELTLESDGPLVVNGQQLTSDTTSEPAFIGGYAIGTGSDRTEYATSQVILGTPESVAWSDSARLTKKGREFVIGEAKKSLDACLKARELAPKGCPMGVNTPDGFSVDPNSLNQTNAWYRIRVLGIKRAFPSP